MRIIRKQNIYCVWIQWPIPRSGTPSTDLAIYIPGVILEVAAKAETANECKKLCLNVKHEFTSMTEWEAPVTVLLELELCHFVAGHRWNSATMLKFREDTKKVCRDPLPTKDLAEILNQVLIRYKELKTADIKAYEIMRRIANELLQESVSNTQSSSSAVSSDDKPKIVIIDVDDDDEPSTPPAKRMRADDTPPRSSKRSRPWPAPAAHVAPKPAKYISKFYGPTDSTIKPFLPPTVVQPPKAVSFNLAVIRSQRGNAGGSTSPTSQVPSGGFLQGLPSHGNNLLNIAVEKNVALKKKIEDSRHCMSGFLETIATIQLQATALDKQVKNISGQPSAPAAQVTAIVMQLDSLADGLKREINSSLIETGAQSLQVKQPMTPLPQHAVPVPQAAAPHHLPTPTAIRACTSCDGWMVLQYMSRALGNTCPEKPLYLHAGGKSPKDADTLTRHTSSRFATLEYILDRNSPKHQGFLAALGFPEETLVTIPQQYIYPNSHRVASDSIPKRVPDPFPAQNKAHPGTVSRRGGFARRGTFRR